MATPVNVAAVEMLFRQDEQQVENVFHVAAPHPLDSATADGIQTIVDAWITGTLRDQQASNVFYYGLRVKDVNAGGNVYDYAGDGLGGSHSGGPLANHVTIALKKNSGVSGRKFRGRFYHLGLTQTMLNVGSVNSLNNLAVFDLISTYEALRTALRTAGHDMVILYQDHSTHPPTPLGGIEVISITATDNIIDSQRRRLPGRGR